MVVQQKNMPKIVIRKAGRYKYEKKKERAAKKFLRLK